MLSTSQSYICCKCCFQRCTHCGGGFTNHLWQSQACQRKWKEAEAEIQNGHNSMQSSLMQSRQGTPDPGDLDVDSSTMHSLHHKDTVDANSIGSRTEDHDKDVNVHT